MKKKTLLRLLTVLCVLLAAEFAFIGYMTFRENQEVPEPSTEPVLEADPTDNSTEPSTEPSQDPTEDSTEPSTEPKPQTRFLLTFTGDSTLGSAPSDFAKSHHFIQTVGTDYAFPYRNLYEYFANDDLTLVNLESVLADEGALAVKLFNFRAPTEFVQVLTSSSVEAVTLANNHTLDFGEDGYTTTKETLTSAGVAYVEQDRSTIYTTEGGLVVGLYAAAFLRDDDAMETEIAALKSQGAQLIIAAMHWGNEGSYRAAESQKEWAHDLIDAGVDIVWGNHPHTLQPIEEYGDGIIFYSLANCSFGGNIWPKDLDTAILQQEVILNPDGTVSLGELTRIPCRISSLENGQNNFQPTPYEEGSPEYDRVLSKLDGSFKGPDLVVDYSHLEPTKPTDPATPPEGGDTGGDTGGNTGGDSGGDTGGDTGGNTGGDTGGDSGGGSGDSGGGEAPPPEPPVTPDPPANPDPPPAPPAE